MSSERRQLRVLDAHADDDVSYIGLLKNGSFLRFFLAQAVSSLGDWIGVIALAVFAERLGGTTGVGAVMTARVLPGFVVGPFGGVIADRWDRKKTMVVADIIRALVIFSLPFVPNLLYLLLSAAVLESMTLIWGPAKDASLPHFVPARKLTHANSLALMAVYGPMPIASIMFASLASFGSFLGDNVQVLSGLQQSNEALALWVDSITFGFSALMISTLAIPSSRRRAEKFDLGAVRRDLVEGLSFVRRHRQVRPWLIGIAFTFTAAGGVFSLGVEFVDRVLGGGDAGFGFLIGFLGAGMIVGLLASGALAVRIQRDVLFTASIFLLGGAVIALASMGSLDAAIPVASALGFFGGVAYSTGYALMQASTRDELRGRTFSAAYTLIRIGTLVGLGVFPFIAGAIGDHQVEIFGRSWPLPGSRITLWIAGLVVIAGGRMSMAAIRARAGTRMVAGRGYLVAFEGGEGAGKTTQIEAFVRWLDARGYDVVSTREPGGTEIGRKIREILLDPAASRMDPRTEALLYAADRAQHVAEVIAPALEQGKVVVSDRFVDSSLAYQGIARGLGLEEIYQMSKWATSGVVPDLVFFLELDPDAGLSRAGAEKDRIEAETVAFHAKVATAYKELAARYPDRFVVVAADRPPSEIHAEVVEHFESRSHDETVPSPANVAQLGGPFGR